MNVLVLALALCATAQEHDDARPPFVTPASCFDGLIDAVELGPTGSKQYP